MGLIISLNSDQQEGNYALSAHTKITDKSTKSNSYFLTQAEIISEMANMSPLWLPMESLINFNNRQGENGHQVYIVQTVFKILSVIIIPRVVLTIAPIHFKVPYWVIIIPRIVWSIELTSVIFILTFKNMFRTHYFCHS